MNSEVHSLRFVRHSRDLGFSLAEIAELVGLWQNRRRPSRQVKALAQHHIEDLVRSCPGDERPECPILDGLARDGAPDPVAGKRARHGHRVPG